MKPWASDADMSSTAQTLDLLLSTPVLRAVFGAGVLGYALWNQRRWQQRMVDVLYAAVPVLATWCIARAWLHLVNAEVTEPYLDEIFHIPQAQVYCKGGYFDWDDKITTPPGLYILSIIWLRLGGHTECSAGLLRRFNVDAIATTALLAVLCRSAAEQQKKPTTKTPSLFSLHTALNIALFPVLFFYSGLYYTDVLSTCLVLAAYSNHLVRVGGGPAGSSLRSGAYTVLLGALALSMRQTNIFWVVVYMGAQEAVQALKDVQAPKPDEQQPATTLSAQIQSYARRYARADVHDPPLGQAWPADLALCAASLAVALACNPVPVLRRVWPHLAVLGLFGGFVAWNGGVVLGDKENHVATLHLAQMLYIWPLFAFFSAPLLLPQVVRAPVAARRWAEQFVQLLRPSDDSPAGPLPTEPPSLSATIPKLTKHRRPGPTLSAAVSKRTPPPPPQPQSRPLKICNQLCSARPLHSLIVVGLCTLAALLVVRLNTIVHPFTLADNRHYMFYVFRHTIRRGAPVRYGLVPVYVLAGWLCWSVLYGGAGGEGDEEEDEEHGKSRDAAAPAQAPPTSTVLALLLATALSLMTAPLVEPRYFILPWVFWRLLVPPMDVRGLRRELENSNVPVPLLPTGLPAGLDPRLVLETVWFLAINAATMYVFLRKTFTWDVRDGAGAVVGQSVERFMW